MNSGYASHIPLLTAAVITTTGPVLELGAGLGSTPMLHGLCGSAYRELLTIESDANWYNKFTVYGRPWHKFKLVDSFLELPEYELDWGLVFVDHGIAEQRSHSVLALKQVPIIIIHDTCHPRLYSYDDVLPLFKYRYDWRIVLPQTTIVSDSIDVGQLFGVMGL